MSDRHFDQLATRFAEKIYGGAKGAIRLAVLQADLAEALPDRPLRVLDIGGGLGHMSLWLAERGHDVTFTEPAEPMLEGARQRFAEKIYGGAKGAIRLAVLQADLAETLPDRPLRVLDIGAGLGHMSLWLAQRGHDVTLAEPAEPMLEGARQRFAEAGQHATFIQAPWQELLGQLTEPYDLVLCHAVLEWLAEPHAILPVLHQLTRQDGWLSLAFYNRDALIYRNLLKGHFRKMRKNDMAGEKQSLTPQQPLDPRELATQLEGLWQVETQSGVRVFHDYMPVEFQARAELVDLLEMELAHRRHPSFAGLGRYLHWICRPI